VRVLPLSCCQCAACQHVSLSPPAVQASLPAPWHRNHTPHCTALHRHSTAQHAYRLQVPGDWRAVHPQDYSTALSAMRLNKPQGYMHSGITDLHSLHSCRIFLGPSTKKAAHSTTIEGKAKSAAAAQQQPNPQRNKCCQQHSVHCAQPPTALRPPPTPHTTDTTVRTIALTAAQHSHRCIAACSTLPGGGTPTDCLTATQRGPAGYKNEARHFGKPLCRYSTAM
jgi:hypothetical protein